MNVTSLQDVLRDVLLKYRDNQTDPGMTLPPRCMRAILTDMSAHPAPPVSNPPGCEFSRTESSLAELLTELRGLVETLRANASEEGLAEYGAGAAAQAGLIADELAAILNKWESGQ
jgi:hypothetical protein